MANEKILIVEDERNFARYLQIALKSLGYVIVGAVNSGKEAVQKAAETEPDLVLMDIMLKGEVDGVEAARQIHAGLDMPVVYLTAHSEEDVIRRAEITEPFGYLLKPFEKRELHTTIQIALYRHKLEKRLKDSGRWLSATLNSIGDAVIATDAGGCVKFINPVAEVLTGWKEEDALSRDFREVFNVIDERTRTATENRPAARAIREGVVAFLPDNTVVVSKGGTEIPVSGSAAPLRDERGSIQGAVLVFRDITRQKQMEEALRRAHDELEAQVQERTAELKKTNEALEAEIAQRQKMQGELLRTQKLESIGTLAGGIAHDFNNMLTTILGNVSLMKISTSPSDKAYKRLIEAENACIRARVLTKQLLTFSKGGAPVKRVTSISEVIKESAEFVLKGSGVKCEFSVAEDLYPAEVDEGQISQVMHNLVTNAQQAMPGGGAIKIKAENLTSDSEKELPFKEGKYVRITVEDRGTGIPEEQLSKIFDPYFTTKRKGSGLGLTVVYSIVKNHDGYVGVESEVGAGTKFYVYLPAAEADKARKNEETTRVLRGQGKVLIMDDDELIREVAGEILRQVGYEVEFAKDGAEAIEKYERAMHGGSPLDLVIMDLTVPGGMGGKEAIEKLRGIDPAVRAVVSSGYSNDPIMADYKNYGFRGVVSKPYKIEEFSKVVHKVINET